MMAQRARSIVEDGFQPVPLHRLRMNSVTNFDLYIEMPGRNNEGRYMLYRKRNIPFQEETRQNLTASGTEVLYIDSSDSREYQLYLENNLGAIIEDEEIPAAEKSKAAYECATGLVEGLLEHPRSGEHIKRSKTFIENLVRYMLDDSGAFFSLMQSTSFNYYTYTHSVNVSVFGIALAHRLDRFTQETINTMGSGLILHDIGKGLIDQKILNKKGPLDKNEWDIMKKHPEYGANLLRERGLASEQALIIVEGHHERLDGSGYPRGLRGSDIHQYARIAAIADVFDAMTTERPHRPAMSSFAALEIMRNEMIDGLDRDIFREFILLLGDQAPATQIT